MGITVESLIKGSANWCLVIISLRCKEALHRGACWMRWGGKGLPPRRRGRCTMHCNERICSQHTNTHFIRGRATTQTGPLHRLVRCGQLKQNSDAGSADRKTGVLASPHRCDGRSEQVCCQITNRCVCSDHHWQWHGREVLCGRRGRPRRSWWT